MYIIDNSYRNIREGNDHDWDGLNNEDDWEHKKIWRSWSKTIGAQEKVRTTIGNNYKKIRKGNDDD